MSQNQIQPYQRTKELLSSEDIRQRFNDALAERAGGFIASLLNTVYQNEGLRDCEPNSIITAALTAASLDLPIDPNLGFAWMIPYRDRKKGTKSARFQMGYKGYVQLALRTNLYTHLNAGEIYEGEEVKENRLTGMLSLTGEPTSDNVIGYTAYMRLTSGFEHYVYMTNEEIIAHAQKYSQSYGDRNSAWTTNYRDMALKTVLLRLMKRYGVLSIKIQSAMMHDVDAGNNVIDGEELIKIVDERQAALTDGEQPAESQESPAVREWSNNLISALVDSDLASDEYSATELLAKSGLTIEAKPKDAVKWARHYYGALSAGDNEDAAIAHADNKME